MNVEFAMVRRVVVRRIGNITHAIFGIRCPLMLVGDFNSAVEECGPRLDERRFSRLQHPSPGRRRHMEPQLHL